MATKGRTIAEQKLFNLSAALAAVSEAARPSNPDSAIADMLRASAAATATATATATAAAAATAASLKDVPTSSSPAQVDDKSLDMGTAAPITPAKSAEQEADEAIAFAIEKEKNAPYPERTIAELKTLCARRGLNVSGNKSQLVQRLKDHDAGIPPPSRKRRSTGEGEDDDSAETKKPRKMQDKKVLQLITMSGFADKPSSCTLAAIGRHYLAFTGKPEELDAQAVFEGKPMEIACVGCSATVKPTLRMLLKQGEYAGHSYEEGCPGSSIKCTKCKLGLKVAFLCTGHPSSDCGKGFNHCTQCKGFGQCIGDYRNAHCHQCNKHYYQGNSGFDCPCRDRDARGRNNDCSVM